MEHWIGPFMKMFILLVDDNPVQAEARRAILTRSGAEVVVARSAAEALARLEEPGCREGIGLLVTDHLMPGMNGPELVRLVRALLPNLPVLVLSGLPDAEEAYADSPVLFRLKPFPPAELIRLTRHMLSDRTLRTA